MEARRTVEEVGRGAVEAEGWRCFHEAGDAAQAAAAEGPVEGEGRVEEVVGGLVAVVAALPGVRGEERHDGESAVGRISVCSWEGGDGEGWCVPGGALRKKLVGMSCGLFLLHKVHKQKE